MCEYDDGEYCQVWNEQQRKARKEHKCSCCGRIIRAGEKYLVHFSVYDGDATSNKMCSECERDRDTFAKAHHGFLLAPYYFPEALSGCIADGDPGSDKRWRPMLDAIEARGGAGP